MPDDLWVVLIVQPLLLGLSSGVFCAGSDLKFLGALLLAVDGSQPLKFAEVVCGYFWSSYYQLARRRFNRLLSSLSLPPSFFL